MAVRTFKPTSPGRRFMTVADFDEVTTTEPEKSLLAPVKRTGGRNNNGRITTRHQGGGHKRRYRIIDFKRLKDGVPAKVAAIEYDPNRSARIALLHYADGAKALHPGAAAADGRRDGAERRRGRHQAGQRAAAGGHPDRHRRARHRAAARPGRADGRSAGTPRSWCEGGRARRCCACRPASCGACPSTAARPSARSATDAPERVRRQGRPRALAGQAPGGPRHRDEPGRPPARRRRGQEQGLAHPVTPWGKPTLGCRTRNTTSARPATSSAAASAARAGSRR